MADYFGDNQQAAALDTPIPNAQNARGPFLSWPGRRPFTPPPVPPFLLCEEHCLPNPQVNDAFVDWYNQIYWGDNLDVLGHLREHYAGQVDLIYLDPPFASQSDYSKQVFVRGSKSSNPPSFLDKQYADCWDPGDYLQFIYERLLLCRELLKETGSLFFHCDWHQSHQLRMLLDEVFGTQNFVNEIIWAYRTGGGSKRWFGRKHDTIFFYAKTGKYRFFPQVERSYLAHKYGFSNVNIKLDADSRPYTEVAMRDFWELDALRGNQPEALGYPTQKPSQLLERIITATTTPGDLVFDGFSGAGTTAAVAQRLGRRFIVADSNLASVETTLRRVLFEDSAGKLQVWSSNPSPGFLNHAQAKTALRNRYHPQSLPNKLFDGRIADHAIKIMPIHQPTTFPIVQHFVERAFAAEISCGTKPSRLETGHLFGNQKIAAITLLCPDFSAQLLMKLKQHYPLLNLQLARFLPTEAPALPAPKADSTYFFTSDKPDRRDDSNQAGDSTGSGHSTPTGKPAVELAVHQGHLLILDFAPPLLNQRLAQLDLPISDWRQITEGVAIEFSPVTSTLTEVLTNNTDEATPSVTAVAPVFFMPTSMNAPTSTDTPTSTGTPTDTEAASAPTPNTSRRLRSRLSTGSEQVFRPNHYDFPAKNQLVRGIYPIPAGSQQVTVKLTDLLNQSLTVTAEL